MHNMMISVLIKCVKQSPFLFSKNIDAIAQVRPDTELFFAGLY